MAREQAEDKHPEKVAEKASEVEGKAREDGGPGSQESTPHNKVGARHLWLTPVVLPSYWRGRDQEDHGSS
jgi:hypothetical protein